MRRSYHVLTEDWAQYYDYDPERPPLWDGGCSFFGVTETCPGLDTDDELIPFAEPQGPDKLLQAHRVCLDAEYGPGGWTRAEIPYDD